jgi:hypothetical protein
MTKIPVSSKINTEFLRVFLTHFDYSDILVCDLLKYGFPIGFEGDECSLGKKEIMQSDKNYKGATNFPVQVEDYLVKEMNSNAIIGPFKGNPFDSSLIISPLNTVPKKSVEDRRIILDLSSSHSSVNSFIDKDWYLGESVNLFFPKIDDFVKLILIKGQGALMFKKDLSRAYRQIPICPSNYNLVSFSWKDHIFCDTVLSMGLRSAAQICQRVTNAIAYILLCLGIAVLNYLDDFAGVERKEHAHFAYLTLTNILSKSGIEEAVNKCCPPSESMVFLGVLFNSNTMTMEVTPERLLEIRNLIKSWLVRETASVKNVQSLLGKLNFIGACVKPSRIFVNRLLNWLRSLDKTNRSQVFHIPFEVRQDLIWWDRFLPLYNGISLMSLGDWSHPDEVFSSDACLQGCGGFWKGNFFHTMFPDFINHKNLHIGALEMLSLVICLKFWSTFFKHQRIVVLCDNLSVCIAVNTGKTRCPYLQKCLREICFLAAIHEFEIKAQHLSSEDNRVSDHLSRWHMNPLHEKQFLILARDYNLKEWTVDPSLFEFMHTW